MHHPRSQSTPRVGRLAVTRLAQVRSGPGDRRSMTSRGLRRRPVPRAARQMSAQLTGRLEGRDDAGVLGRQPAVAWVSTWRRWAQDRRALPALRGRLP